MKYKLEFVKISDNHKFAGVGFAGNIFITLNALSHINDEDRLIVDMETNECVCSEKKELFNTKNCWQYYFDQEKIEEGENFIKINSLISAKINYEDRNVFLYPENFVWLKNKFYNSFKLKNEIEQILENYYENNIKNKVTLGVQVRLTDMKHYHNVSPLSTYLKKIKDILKEKPQIEQIFLSTDDGSVIEELKNSLPIPIIYYEDMFRADKNNPHIHPYDRFEYVRNNHLYILGLECIQEIFTLSKCDFMLKADVSSISIIASILSEKIQKVYKI